ncbi:MAG: glucokinase [Solirubrobacteraceae bacterium]|jgi:glucokinase|nr:glucokinase [Solirubrobacteraceae bacterium]MEA2290969.1 glucokinase [Solirubrobacteraceae bacterium]
MDPTTITGINEFLVLDAIREEREITRPALGDKLRLSPASVSRIVRRLVQAGMVLELPGASDGPGRNRAIIRFNDRAGALLAMDLGGTKCHGALVDLAGETIAEDFRPTREAGDPVATLLSAIATLRSEADRRSLPVRAIVIGIPAVPDPETGLVVAGPNVDWSGFDLVGELQRHITEPFRIENDVKLAAIGQAWRGEGRAIAGFVTLSIGTGIGGALFANGQLVRGRHNAAGEIGYLLTSRDQLRAEPGTVAGLESVASGPALARRARELLAEGVTSELAAEATAADVFAAAARQDPIATQVVDELLDHIAMAIVGIVAVVDPGRVILDGSVGRALAPYLDELRDRIAPRVPDVPELVVSKLGPNATIAGAIACALSLDRELDARRALAEVPDDAVLTLTRPPTLGSAASGGGFVP